MTLEIRSDSMILKLIRILLMEAGMILSNQALFTPIEMKGKMLNFDYNILSYNTTVI